MTPELDEGLADALRLIAALECGDAAARDAILERHSGNATYLVTGLAGAALVMLECAGLDPRAEVARLQARVTASAN